MSISENDVSILIPTYRYRNKVGRAVESALASGAGEIIVTDDCSSDGTMELLAGYDEPRLRVFENPVNLGLWENHLAALGHATRPWIKFIQADDYLLPNGLAAYAAAAAPGVNVVWSNPLVNNEMTGANRKYYTIKKAWRLTGEDYLNLAVRSCWLLGSPSQMMLRTETVVRDPAAWITDISTDVILGTLAARQGDVVLLPTGAIAQTEHESRDMVTQSRLRGLRRSVATAQYLKAQSDPTVRRFGVLWAAVNRNRVWRTALSGTLRGQIRPREALHLVQRHSALANDHAGDERDRQLARDGRAFRRHARKPYDIDGILAREIVADGQAAA